MEEANQIEQRGFRKVYEALHQSSYPGQVEFGDSAAPLFSKASGFLRGYDLTMQVQVGCPGGCLYCYVPSNSYFTSARTRGKDGQLWGFRVFNKQHVAEQFRLALAGGELRDKTIYWSGVTDPYAAPPAVTRSVWEQLIQSESRCGHAESSSKPASDPTATPN